jgi:hypothetical protein
VSENNIEIQDKLNTIFNRKKEVLRKRMSEFQDKRFKLPEDIENKKEDIGPSPAYYFINYNQIEENAPSVNKYLIKYSLRGKLEKQILKENQIEGPNLDGNEQNSSLISKNINKSLITPNYNIVKTTIPSFSFTKAERFEDEKSQNFPGPNYYYPEQYLIDKEGKTYL